MPGMKRKIDEDTWLVTQSKKFKQGFSLNSVYETTLAYLRLGASNFFKNLISGGDDGPTTSRSSLSPAADLNTSQTSTSSLNQNASTVSASEGRLSPTPSSPARSNSSGGSGQDGAATPPIANISPPGSPVIRDVLNDNELQEGNPGSPRALGMMQSAKPNVICQDCVRQSGGKPFGNEDSYGKCSWCDKLVCHLNTCRKCKSDYCGGCCISMYDESSVDTYECYHCL